MYRNHITLVVLSEEPIPDNMDMEDVAREYNEGDYVLHTYEVHPEPLTDEQMAAALVAAGSEPGFFMLDEVAP